MTEGKNADDDKNEDGKMRMIKCGWKKADEKNANYNVRTITDEGKLTIFLWRPSIFNILGREKWNIRQ